MAGTKDPRRRVGAIVHAKATAVTNLAQCGRLFGSEAERKLVHGTVVEVVVGRSRERSSTSLRVEWTLVERPSLLI